MNLKKEGNVPGYDVSLNDYCGFNNKRLEHYMLVGYAIS